jgi:MFS family permease
MQGENQLLFLSTLGVWALGAACLGPTIPAYANDVIPAAHRGLGVALFRSAGDLGFMSAPVLVGALVDATSLQIGAQGMAIGVCGSAAVYMLAAVPSKCLSDTTHNEGLDRRQQGEKIETVEQKARK